MPERTTVTLSDDLSELLRRLGWYLGSSRGSTIYYVLEQNRDFIVKTLEMFERGPARKPDPAAGSSLDSA